jgi:hypothetical protein
LSYTRTSSTVHKEDGGLVYSSIRNDGKMIHWCDKCNRMWVSTEKPESEISKRLVPEREIVRSHAKLSRLDMDEARDYLKRFRTSRP